MFAFGSSPSGSSSGTSSPARGPRKASSIIKMSMFLSPMKTPMSIVKACHRPLARSSFLSPRRKARTSPDLAIVSLLLRLANVGVVVVRLANVVVVYVDGVEPVA